MKINGYLLILSILFLSASSVVRADLAEAEDVAYRMAIRYSDRGFKMAPTDHSGVMLNDAMQEFKVPVVKGLDYVFLVGSDDFAEDVDIYVYDEVGQLIVDDRRSRSQLAGVQFRSSYTGYVKAYLHIPRRFSGPAAWYVLAGRRGASMDSDATGD